MPNAIRDIIDHTRRQLSYADHTPAGLDEPTFRRAKNPAIMSELDLKNERAALDLLAVGVNAETMDAFEITETRSLSVNGGAGDPMYGDGSNAAGVTVAEQHAFDLFKTAPVVARAGAVIEEFPAERGRLLKSGIATFEAVADDEAAPDGGVEFGQFGAWDLGTDAVSYGCTIRATRQLEKLAGPENLELLLHRALTLGAVKVVDQAALAAITAARPAGTGPSVSQLVAAGVDLDKARAIIGTGAHSGQAFDRGAVYFDGMTAFGSEHLTEAAIVGDFSSLVILASPRLDIISKRLDAAGSLEMTAWIEVKPFLLEPGRLFTVGAE